MTMILYIHHSFTVAHLFLRIIPILQKERKIDLKTMKILLTFTLSPKNLVLDQKLHIFKLCFLPSTLNDK